LLDEVLALSGELRELARDQLQLVALETKLAAQSLMTMVAVAVAAGLLLVTAWLGLMGTLVWWLASLGVAIWLALIAVTVLNLLAAVVAYRVIDRRSRNLGFPATLRSLRSLGARADAGKGAPQ
jgi:membrane protein implicated in regulation of membrane protease activity